MESPFVAVEMNDKFITGFSEGNNFKGKTGGKRRANFEVEQIYFGMNIMRKKILIEGRMPQIQYAQKAAWKRTSDNF